MKKIITLIVLVLSVSAYSQNDTSKLSAKYVYEDVKAGFMKLVSSLEGPAKHTYEVYVKQYYINGWSSIILQGLVLLLALTFWLVAFKKGSWENGEPNGAWAIFQIVLGGVFIISLLFFTGDFSANLQRIVNPEYYAIQEIVSTIKN